MRRAARALLPLILTLPLPSTFAATNIVLQGDNLQAKIDAAAAGDVMVVQSGSYSGNIVVGKSLSFVKSGAEPLQIMNTFSVQTTGMVSLSQFQFLEELSGGSADLRLYDCQLSKNFQFNDGKVTLKRVFVAGNTTVNRSDLDTLRLTNHGSFTITGVPASKPKVVMVQSHLRGIVWGDQLKLWMGYSFAQGVCLYNSDVVAVGCDFFNTMAHMTFNGWVIGALMQNCSFRFLNNRFLYACDWVYHHENQSAIALGGCTGEFLNCDIMTRGGGWPGAHPGNGYGIVQWNGKSTVKNCLFDLASHAGERYAIVDYSAVMDLTDSIVFGHYWGPFGFDTSDIHAQLVSGEGRNIPTRTTVVTNECVKLSFSDQWSFSSTLATNSPLVNAGSVEPIYRNVDGTRNTVGSTGGPFYHPENATTDRPIAFWLMTSPRKILKGVDSTLKMEAAAAAGH